MDFILICTFYTAVQLDQYQVRCCCRVEEVKLVRFELSIYPLPRTKIGQS